MINILLVTVFAAVTVGVVHAGRIVDANKLYKAESQNKWLTKRTPSFQGMLGLSSDIKLKPEEETFQTVHGSVQRKFKEVFKGLDVLGGTVEADVDENGEYQGGLIGGTIVLDIASDVPNIYCKYSRTKAIARVLEEEGLQQSDIINVKVKPRQIFTDDKNKAHLAIKVEMLADTGTELRKPHYYIDMCTEKILKHFNKITTVTKSFTESTPTTFTGANKAEISSTGSSSTETASTGSSLIVSSTTVGTTSGDTQTTVQNTNMATQFPLTTVKPEECSIGAGVGGNAKTGKYSYGIPPRCLTPKVMGTKCFMENKYVVVFDAKQTNNTERMKVIEFECSKGYSDAINDAYGPANDAFFHGTITQRMLNEWYQLNPLWKPSLIVHYGRHIEDAVWNFPSVLLGDGYSDHYPFVNLDTIAHEIGHGVTEVYSGLEYSEQSGGMDEAFSDIMGETAESFLFNYLNNSKSDNDWLSGMQDTKDKNVPLRYFDKPSRDGSSIDKASEYTKNLDVHLSCGVYNRAFYQISKIYKVAIRYAFEAFLTANRIYWKTNSNFVNGACGVMRAAYGLGLDVDSFKKGFAAVEIETCIMNDYLQMLTPDQPRKSIKVSSIRQPVFGISLKASTSSVTVTASDKKIKLAISTTWSRDSPAATGQGSVTWSTGGKTGTIYVRLFTDDEKEIILSQLTLSVQ